MIFGQETGKKARERRFRKFGPPVTPEIVKEINAHCPNRRWRQRYAPTGILKIVAFYLAGSYKVICFGECFNLQMKNLPASDTSVKKAKGQNELSPAENAQNYKRAIFIMLRARTTRHRSPAW